MYLLGSCNNFSIPYHSGGIPVKLDDILSPN
jgi:hypothetical protein